MSGVLICLPLPTQNTSKWHWYGSHMRWVTWDRRIPGFHMTSLKFKLQNCLSSWDFTFMIYKSSWKLIFTQIFALNGLLVLWWTTLEFLSFCVTQHLHDGRENCSCIRKIIILMFFGFSRDNSRFRSKTQWRMFLLVFGRQLVPIRCHSLVRYRVEHEKIKFISTSGHVISSMYHCFRGNTLPYPNSKLVILCLLYKHQWKRRDNHKDGDLFTSEDIEDITRWHEDMNFIFEWRNNILRTSAASE